MKNTTTTCCPASKQGRLFRFIDNSLLTSNEKQAIQNPFMTAKSIPPFFFYVLCLTLFGLIPIAGAQENASEKPTADSESPPPDANIEEESEPSVEIQEAVFVGSRRQDRSVAESPVPVDIINQEDLAQQGYTDMHSMLSTVIPSYNVNSQPVSGSPSLVRPAYLRGLPGDSTLVLINGKRRHRASVINVFGAGITDGSHGPDLASIPAIALKRVEVLRDGASAQYGSDAVAGVMNFVLKDDAQGGSIETRWGQYYAGDGGTHTIAANFGLPLKLRGDQNGFANFSFEYTKANPTSRTIQRNNAQGFINRANQLKSPGATLTADEMDRWKIADSTIPLYLADADLTLDEMDRINRANELIRADELEAGAELTKNEIDAGLTRRQLIERGRLTDEEMKSGLSRDRRIARGSLTREQLIAQGLTQEQLIRRGDSVPVPAQYWGIPEIKYDFKFFGNMGINLGDAAQLYFFPSFAQREIEQGFWYRAPKGGRLFKAVARISDGDPNTPDTLFNPRTDLFPGGFTPQFGGTATDMGIASGVRGTLENDWSYDLSGVIGQHKTEFSIWNTVNPQLLHLQENIPTSYEPGGYTELDYTLNLDLSRPVDVEFLYSPLNVALGLEYRVEQYEINAGEENSWVDWSDNGGKPASSGLTLVNWDNFGIGSDGFPGFNPDFAGKTDRGSYAVYVDLEADVVENLLVGAALRYEDYEDFSDKINGKLATRWQVLNGIALRGSFSTGFRVPTVGQANLVDVTSAFDEDGNLVNNATLPPTHPASVTVGSNPLEPETSRNFTLGTAFEVGKLDLTVDYYHIKMKDRIALTSRTNLTSGQIDNLMEQGAPGAAAIRTVRYFANAFDTTTQGIDIVANYPIQHPTGLTTLTFALNANETKVDKVKSSGVDEKRKKQVEENLPEVRFSLAANHVQGPWRFFGRLRYYHDFHEYQSDYEPWEIDAQARLLADAEIGYAFDNGVQLTAGAQNLFDTYPTMNPHALGSGARYPDSSPYGFGGGFYYLKASYTF